MAQAGILHGLAAALLLSALALPARAETVTVEAEGQGATRQAAIAQALVLALEQATGVTIQAEQRSGALFQSIASQDGDAVLLQEQAQTAIARQTGGTAKSYRVLDLTPEAGGFVARLSVEVAVFRPTVNTGETRRRLVVSEFTDQAGRRTSFGEQLRERLIAHLTQSRRFAVLDRANAEAYNREMALLKTDAPLAERVRIGQVLGADYIVIGRMRGVGATRTEQNISITGESVVRTSARGALDFQVLEVATRQVRWAASVAVGNSGNLQAVLEEMATRVGREITQTIYPMRVVRADDPQEIILNQGGVTVSAGQRFRAMLLGEELKDPYTGESLGQMEREIGVVEVHRVDTRVSYARLTSGKLPPPGAEVVLRLMPPAPPAPSRRPAARPQQNRSMFD